MSLLFTAKRTARLPSYLLTLSSTATFDLSTATAIALKYRPQFTTGVPTSLALTNTAPADPTNKVVRLDADAALVSVVGTYECQIEVTIGGLVMVFPQDDFDTFQVVETLE